MDVGCGSLFASSIDLTVVSFEVFCALVGCIITSGVMRRSVCRGGAGMGLSGCGRELDAEVDGSHGGEWR